MSIRVLVADDHPIVRHGVCGVLSETDDITVVGQASSGLEAVARAIETQPDVIVLDLTMSYDADRPSSRAPKVGLDVIAALRDADIPAVPAVVVLSVHGEADTVRSALAAGAVGYVLKESLTSDLPTAVRAARSGNIYLSAELSAVLTRQLPPPRPLSDRLSPREREVVAQIVDGHTSREIAAALFTSPKTVEKQRRDAMRKLGVTNVAALVRVALDQGLNR